MELLGSIEMTSDATTLDLHVNASTILILEMTIPFGMSMRLGIDTMEQATVGSDADNGKIAKFNNIGTKSYLHIY